MRDNTIKITRVVNLPLEFWTVGCRKLITWWPKEVVTWHKKVVMWFVWNGLTVMAFNKEGWFYERGKGPSEELKEQIIDKILETGGDGILGYFPAKWTKLGDKFGVSDHGKPSRINPSFRSPLQARGGIFRITWHYFSDHMTTIEPLRIQIFNGSFTTLLVLIVIGRLWVNKCQVCHWRVSSLLFMPNGCEVLALFIKWASQAFLTESRLLRINIYLPAQFSKI